VITLLEDFELQKGLIDTPVTTSEFRNSGMEVFHIPAEDFNPLSNNQFYQIINILKDSEKLKVYIHCKAGRGRSASGVIAYLMDTKNMTYSDSHKFVKDFRPQISINSRQKGAILGYFGQEEKLSKFSSAVRKVKPYAKWTALALVSGLALYNLSQTYKRNF